MTKKDNGQGRRTSDLNDGHAGRPEPERLNPRAMSEADRVAAAVKVAKHIVRTSAAGKRRAKLGDHGLTPIDSDQAKRIYKRKMSTSVRCTAEKQNGSRCTLAVVKGSDRCHFHEGVERAPWSVAAGRRYLAGTLKAPQGRFKTHPSAVRAKPAKQDE